MSVKHCIKVDDFSGNEILDLFQLASELKYKYRNKESYKPFQDHSMAMIFAKPSARTRVSFETGFAWDGRTCNLFSTTRYWFRHKRERT